MSEQPEMITRREVEELKSIHQGLAPSGGPLEWAASETASMDETVDLIRRKLEHYPDQHTIYAVQSAESPDEDPDSYTLCITGNGPKAAANAEWLSLCVPAVPALIARIEMLEELVTDLDRRLTTMRTRIAEAAR